MTSMLPFLETDDSLLICSICLNELKEPKLLSCLHRYCASCLMGLIDGNDNKLQCPDCGIVHALPENGVEGLLVDISMKNILQLHRIKQAIDTRRKCLSCRNIENAGAFCINCDDFICQNCFDNHGATSKSRHRTLSMNDLKTGQLNNANWAALTDISRCRDHPENMLELCCRTCHGNHLMCRECSLVEHADHELCNDVPYLASEERNRINQKMDNLLNYIERVQKKRALMTKSTEKLNMSLKDENPIFKTNLIAWRKSLKAKYTMKSINLTEEWITKFENCDRKSHVDISEVADDEVDVDGIHSKQWGINGITGNDEGTIVVTGESSQDHSHITVIDLKGTTLRQDEIESDLAFECRYCDFMTKFKVVTVCWNNEIGLYDIRDGTYTEMDLKNNDSVWPFGQDVSCVTVDEANNDIFIGYKDSRDISVFDDQLNYSHALSLPSTVRWPRDIAVHGKNLIVCDRAGMEAYAISITGSTCMVMFQFAKPNTKRLNCWPIGVCTDQNEFIYMLWSAVTMSSFKRLLVQYSRDGQRLLATRHVHDDALCISTVSTRREETLLVSTWKTGKIFQYNLVSFQSSFGYE
ncbi:hypothetical protein BSL78_14905 [Apostichopus japonicus]|uniref:Uncharacterized protein n=1 Tax=Stichopus japonicus TaxID=307972 RepID=A0A2G8KJM9_STIJA|nr:hypothetical protein BSL78_14905 [Apostichopus japonicus]